MVEGKNERDDHIRSRSLQRCGEHQLACVAKLTICAPVPISNQLELFGNEGCARQRSQVRIPSGAPFCISTSYVWHSKYALGEIAKMVELGIENQMGGGSNWVLCDRYKRTDAWL